MHNNMADTGEQHRRRTPDEWMDDGDWLDGETKVDDGMGGRR